MRERWIPEKTFSQLLSLVAIEAWGRETSIGVGAFGSSEEEDVGFRSVDFVVDPTSALLNTKASPFHFGEESATGHLFVCMFGEDDVSILVEVIKVLVRVLDFVGEMGHSGLGCVKKIRRNYNYCSV